MSDLFLPWNIVCRFLPWIVVCCLRFHCYFVVPFCVRVLVVVGWGWLSRLALGALSTTSMLTWFDTLHYYTTLHYYIGISMLHSALFAGFIVGLGPSGPKRLWSLWHLTVGARSGYVFTPQRPPRNHLYQSDHKTETVGHTVIRLRGSQRGWTPGTVFTKSNMCIWIIGKCQALLHDAECSVTSYDDTDHPLWNALVQTVRKFLVFQHQNGACT